METIMNEIMTLCYRYTEMYNAEQRTKVQELITHRN